MSSLVTLVTGADGFIGTRLSEALQRSGHRLRRAVRRAPPGSKALDPSATVVVGDISGLADWSSAVEGVDVVIHLVARAHVLTDGAGSALDHYRAVNVEGSRRLAEAAVRAKVRRLVYVSSIKVNGESTDGTPFRATDPPRPVDPYGISKWEAEEVLRRIAASSGLELAVVRPPLVYGPGVKGNLRGLLRAIALGVPLPLSGIHNRRSLIGLPNLVDLLVRCAESPAAPGETFLAADGRDLSTPELIQHLAAGIGRTPRSFRVPGGLARSVARLLGRVRAFERLWGSLQVDDATTRERLGWAALLTPEQGLRETGAWYRSEYPR